MSPFKRNRSVEGLADNVEAIFFTEPEDLAAHPFSSLLDAVASNDVATAKRLLEQDSSAALDVVPRGLPPMTPPLVQAAWTGNPRLADLLMERSLNMMDMYDVGFGGNPLHWAAAAGRDTILERFLAQAGPGGVNMRSFDGFTPLHAAAGHGHTTCVRLLLQHKADPNVVDLKESAPLHEAAQWGHRDAAKELLQATAKPDSGNGVGETPLLLAARSGYADVVQLLLDHGATLDRPNVAGVTPLLCAAFFGHEPTVKLLQQRGADLRAVDAAKRRNSLEWAAFNNHRKVVEALMGQQRSLASQLMPVASEGDADDVLEFLRSL